ncbi:histo-blood group ABO system transferase 2-like [Lepus europaeus]|uniref:histo-blood group ABO system transferase 2-like n=1 Tax=Lepus europaeus TaxID=9983 RepID=UPI002B481F60|nr:histo-blood group ABO system transferase 2-like [Lepus europaeus]
MGSERREEVLIKGSRISGTGTRGSSSCRQTQDEVGEEQPLRKQPQGRYRQHRYASLYLMTLDLCVYSDDSWEEAARVPGITLTFHYCYWNPKSQHLKSLLAGTGAAVRESHTKHLQPDALTPSRRDVLVLTPWLAPIVWEGTFDIDLLNAQFKLQNATVGLTVFAVKNYMSFLELFLRSAEKYFMAGHRVNYYIFTDQPELVPRLPLHSGRRVIVLRTQSHERWQDISMQRMGAISQGARQRFLQEVDYLVCADVDIEFRDHVGVEILSSLFGTIHPDFTAVSRYSFSNERRPESQAYIPEDEGDFYYIGAFFGGSVPEVYRLTEACHQAIMIDKANHLEAIWQEESHLNKYLLYHKPTKLLSPEYMCDNDLLKDMQHQKKLGLSNIVRRIRIFALLKNKEVKSGNASQKVQSTDGQ